MIGSPKLITALNDRLAEEYAAIRQYRTHAGMTKDWGYFLLASQIEGRYAQEEEHAEELTARILLLGGDPVPDKTGLVVIGPNIPAQFAADLKAEQDALDRYSETIALAFAEGDHTTRTLLEHIAGEELQHLHWLEQQINLAAELGFQNYATTLIR
jgi:bacterioferritin